MGYDSPMNVFTDAPSTSYAHDGAPALDSFQAGLRASHDDVAAAGPSVNTVIGHSYGSTLVGAAGVAGYLDANNVVTVGNPGVLAEHATDLNLAPGAHVFATRAENDLAAASLDRDDHVPRARIRNHNLGHLPRAALKPGYHSSNIVRHNNSYVFMSVVGLADWALANNPAI